MAMISAPIDWVESVSELRLPAKTDRRLQELMDRNTEGQLTYRRRALTDWCWYNKAKAT